MSNKKNQKGKPVKQEPEIQVEETMDDELLDEGDESEQAVEAEAEPETVTEAPKAPEPAPKAVEADGMKSWKTLEERTKHELSLQPQVAFLIPLMPGESAGAYETVQINGYRLTIKKGVMVNLPQAVVEILAESYQVQLSAGLDKLTSRNQSIEDALN